MAVKSKIIPFLGAADTVEAGLEDPSILGDIDMANQLAADLAAGRAVISPWGALASIQAGYAALTSGLLVMTRDIKENKGAIVVGADILTVFGDAAIIVGGVANLVPTPIGKSVAAVAEVVGLATTIGVLTLHNEPKAEALLSDAYKSVFGSSPTPSTAMHPSGGSLSMSEMPAPGPLTGNGPRLEVGTAGIDPIPLFSAMPPLTIPAPPVRAGDYVPLLFGEDTASRISMPAAPSPGPTMLQPSARTLAAPHAAGRRSPGGHRPHALSAPRLPPGFKAPAGAATGSGLNPPGAEKTSPYASGGRSRASGDLRLWQLSPGSPPARPPRREKGPYIDIGPLFIVPSSARADGDKGDGPGDFVTSLAAPAPKGIFGDAGFPAGVTTAMPSGVETAGGAGAVFDPGATGRASEGPPIIGAADGVLAQRSWSSPAAARVSHGPAWLGEETGRAPWPMSAIPGGDISIDRQAPADRAARPAANPTPQPVTLAIDDLMLDRLVRNYIDRACSGAAASSQRPDPGLRLIPPGMRWDA